jgi:hypothetical protein
VCLLEIFPSSSFLPPSGCKHDSCFGLVPFPKHCYSRTTFLIMCFSTFLSCNSINHFPFYSKVVPCNWKGTQHHFALVDVPFYFYWSLL